MPSTSFSFGSDFVGRIRNISLSPSAPNTLIPLFEAITNSIQAIEERFEPDRVEEGRVEIEVIRDRLGDPIGFSARDNGVGLNRKNFDAFKTSDTRYKLARGGKGVGRFLWIKVFEKAHVRSVFGTDKTRTYIEFDFVADERQQIRNFVRRSTRAEIGTEVILSPFRSSYASFCPKKSTTIKNKIVSHFLRFFISDQGPSFIMIDEGESTDLRSEFMNVIHRQADYKFSIMIGTSQIDARLHAMLLPKEYTDDEKGINAVFYGANGRTVRRYDLDGAIGLKQIQGRFAFFGFVESELLDALVNQERTDFSWSDEAFELLHRAVIEKAKEFLSDEIGAIRQRQAETVERVRNEHLRFLNVVRSPDEFAKSLALSVQKPEDIFLEMSRMSLRKYNRKKREFNESRAKKLSDFTEKASEYTKELEGESISSLAEYVYKRKLILDVLDQRLAFRSVPDQVFHLEEAVHELICPLRSDTDTLGYDDHNLWIIDDNLAFYTYFASDRTFSRVTGGSERSKKEMDVAIFDLGLGFDRPGSPSPISIIEFKRPGRDDYRLNDNPFIQVRD